MDKYIDKRIQDQVEGLKMDYAQNYIAKEYHSQFDTPESKKQVESAAFNMTKTLEKIEWFEKLVSSRKKTKVTKKK